MPGLDGKIIYSWAGVADFLGVAVATAKRWHSMRPIPIMQATPRGRVMVYGRDLRAWLDQLSPRPQHRANKA